MKWFNRSTAFIGVILVFSLGTLQAQTIKDGALTPKMIQTFRESFKLNAHTRAVMNAVTRNDVSKLALNRRMLTGYDSLFSHRIKTGAITNQKRSGRCWLFAGLNILRPVVRKKLDTKHFEFSESYPFFWDKMEKANFFLESIIKTRKRDLSDRKVEFLLKHPFPDGGQWNFVVALIEKYGVVPGSIMPESRQSSNTGLMNRLVSRKLRKDAAVLRQMSQKGERVPKLRARKTEMLGEIYHILALNFGVPPTQFRWRYKDKNGNLSKTKTYTPQEFFHQVVDVNLNDYVSLYNCPTHPYNKLFQISLDRNMANYSDLTFININIDSLKAFTRRSILADEPVWFGCDVGKESDIGRGILAPAIYDYSDIYGVNFKLTKKERILYHDSVPTHAMVFTGVDIANGKPVKWLVENSWGAKAGSKGYLIMFDKWFNDYVYEVVINKKYLPPSVLALLKTRPVVLPPWDPMYALLQ
ncbi:aminopeptidase C [bacterium BMS3Bbin03]|nr:aminopeptidase C [bacterium BMS3Bbin03]HDL77986.1 aminopeptidase [Bacteroidota bacterium]HDZ11257.1 aminopeptidase [Bacteroidota bacterium]